MLGGMELGIVAGEASGDRQAAALVEELRARHADWHFFGCGGERMRQAGCELLLDARQLSLLGLAEVVRHLPRLYRLYRRLWKEIARRRPRALVLVDFPDFNLRLARRAAAAGIPVIYFISPQVWAWRPGRVRLLRRTVRRMICIFPFETAFYARHGMAADFVGHPLTEQIKRQEAGCAEFLHQAGCAANRPVVALLPGSRRRELEFHLPVLAAAARRLYAERQIHFLLPVAPGLELASAERQLERPDQKFIHLLAGQSERALTCAQVAVVASGTATLEAALLETPSLVVYRLSRWTYWLGRRLVRTPYIAMPNLILGAPVLPELIQNDFTPEAVVNWVRKLLDEPATRQQMADRLAEVREQLGPPGAIARAADCLESELGTGPSNTAGTPGLHETDAPAQKSGLYHNENHASSFGYWFMPNGSPGGRGAGSDCAQHP